MTTKELFKELRTIPSGLGCMDSGCEGCSYEEEERERVEEEIIKQIQSDLLKEILKLHFDVFDGTTTQKGKVVDVICVDDIKRLAEYKNLII